jgi:hypothetical protein
MDAKVLEDWLRLTADALKGAEQARKALDALGSTPLTPEALSRWTRLWLGEKSSQSPDPSALQDAVEEYWKALGVVPRHRYLELLDRYEELKARLEEAESTVKNLRELLAERGQEGAARGALDEWERLTRQALETQAEWARTWAGKVLAAPEGKKPR